MFLNADIYSLMRQSVNLDILIGAFVETKTVTKQHVIISHPVHLSWESCSYQEKV